MKLGEIVRLHILVFSIFLGISFHPPTVYKITRAIASVHPVWKALKIVEISHGISTQNAVAAGVELGVFDVLDKNANGLTLAELAKELKTPLRSTRILVDVLTTNDVLYETQDGVITNLPCARDHLVSGKHDSFDWLFRLLSSESELISKQRTADVIRAGGTTLPADRSAEAPDHPFWWDFAKVTKSGMKQGAAALANFAKEAVPDAKAILDIASGSGTYGYTLATVFPTAHVSLFDYGTVLEHTAKNAEEWKELAGQVGPGKRVQMAPGDFFKGLPHASNHYDLIAVPNFYHHFSPSVCQDITNAVFKALKPGGVMIISEFVRPEGVPGPRDEGTFFGFMMLAWSKEGDSYRASDYKLWADKAGFVNFETKTAFPMPATFILARKPKSN